MAILKPGASRRDPRKLHEIHALVIGVGWYGQRPAEGSGLLVPNPALPALRSIAPSVASIVDFLMEEMDHPNANVADIELLFSDEVGGVTLTTPKGHRYQATAPTMVNVDKAITDWKHRCGGRRDDVTFFYIASHGFPAPASMLDPYAVTEDFDPRSPSCMDFCIDFDGMIAAMISCDASEQWFFADGCRNGQIDWHAKLPTHPPGKTFGGIYPRIPDLRRTVFAVHAAPQGSFSFGDPAEGTFFGQALASALRNDGADSHSGRGWEVGTYLLKAGIDDALNDLRERYAADLAAQRIEIQDADFLRQRGRSVLHRLHHPPTLGARIGCDPDAYTNSAHLRAVTINANPQEYGPSDPALRGGGPWKISLKSDIYRFEAAVPPAGFASPSGMNITNVSPTAKTVYIDVSGQKGIAP
jgi:hypothetical protein